MSLRVERSETTQSQHCGITSFRYRCIRNDNYLTGHDMTQLRIEKQLQIVPKATHLFQEPGALEAVAQLATE